MFAAGAGHAQAVLPCDWQASAQAIVEPWEENTRTFANGNVRLAAIDTVEPAVAFAYLLVLSPPFNTLGERQCRLIGSAENLGFAGMDFSTLTAGYDPASGLTFEIQVNQHDPATGDHPRRFLFVTLNQSTGAVTAQIGADAR